MTVAGLAGCDDCEPTRDVPDPSLGVGQNPLEESPGNEPAIEPEEAMGVDEPNVQPTPPLEQAFSAPDDAVTSEGRFAELMEQGLAEHAPPTGLVFASGGVDQPTTRVIVTPDGQARWARGDGMYWDELDETGEVELDENERKVLADLVERAWTERELDYPPSAAGRGEVLVLRDEQTARVIEGSQLPQEVLPLRQLLMHATQPTKP
jgi:hypothetical protein